MRKHALATLIFLVFIILPAASQTLLLNDPKIDAGTVPKGAVIKKDFVVRNSGTADLHILSVKPMCGCSTAEFDKLIRPGAEGKITITVDTKSFQGTIVKIANVVSDDPVNSSTTITIVANVQELPAGSQQAAAQNIVTEGFPAMVVEQVVFDAGNVHKGDLIKHDFIVENSGEGPLEIVHVQPACGCTTTQFDKDIAPGKSGKITATLNTANFTGPIQKTISVTTNDLKMANFQLTIKAVVKAILNVEPSEYQQFGLMQKGQTLEKVFTLKAEDGTAFEVTQVNANDPALKYDLKPAADKKSAEFRVTVSADHPLGLISGRFTLATTHPKAPTLILSVYGMVRGPHGETAEATQNPPSNPASPAASKMTNAEVIQLVTAGLSDQVVTTSIRQAAAKDFDLTPTGLIALKKAGVSDALIVAMQERSVPLAEPPKPAPAPEPQSPCSGIELMGLYKKDMRPMSPLIVYLANIRNGTQMTRIVTLQWLNMYGVAKQATVQVGAGQIVSLQLGMNSPRDRQPIDLQLTSCQ